VTESSITGRCHDDPDEEKALKSFATKSSIEKRILRRETKRKKDNEVLSTSSFVATRTYPQIHNH
jgi:hypothetical protein